MSTVIVLNHPQANPQHVALVAMLLNQQTDILRIDLGVEDIDGRLPSLLKKHRRPVLLAIGKAAEIAWQIAGQYKNLGGLLLIHPDILSNFATHRLLIPCLLIHASSTTLTDMAILQTLQRPRPDIAQLIDDHPEVYFDLMIRFIQQFSGVSPDSLSTVIRCEEIAKGFPAPAPGARTVFEDKYCMVGAVQLDQHEPFEHINYRDELHVVISGSGHFRHGDGELIEVKQGDLVYVKAFEKHRWSNWSNEFKLLYIQTGPNPFIMGKE